MAKAAKQETIEGIKGHWIEVDSNHGYRLMQSVELNGNGPMIVLDSRGNIVMETRGPVDVGGTSLGSAGATGRRFWSRAAKPRRQSWERKIWSGARDGDAWVAWWEDTGADWMLNVEWCRTVRGERVTAIQYVGGMTYEQAAEASKALDAGDDMSGWEDGKGNPVSWDSAREIDRRRPCP